MQDHSITIKERYKSGLESTMEQKRIVIDQGSRYSLLISSFKPIHIILSKRHGKGNKEERMRI